MGSWRDSILKHFQPKFSRLTLVADPDGLLTEEGTLSSIRQRGFELIPFDDSIAFRFAYESQYRSLWDKGLTTDLVVVLRSREQDLSRLPFDLLKAGRQLTFALHQIFPGLNYPVVAGLDRVHLDAAYAAYPKHGAPQLTERETKDFVLTHCFGIVPKLIKSPVDLLKLLLSLHSRKVRLPENLAVHILEPLAPVKAFAGWPLADILADRTAFLQFLQDDWKVFLDDAGELAPRCRVPFTHEDVRAYIDTFFLDGSLIPVEHGDVSGLPAWVQAGIVHDPKTDALRRFAGLRQAFEGKGIPDPDSSHHDWQTAAERWAELVVLRWEWDEALAAGDRAAWVDLQAKVEDEFGKWMLERYSALHNLPYHQQPVMVHQIPRFLAAERTKKKVAKTALLVLDGLALDQWIVLRRCLQAGDKAWRMRESAAFAWVPTLTSISRQAIFAGELPLYFPESLLTTSKEKSHWLKFWEDQGVPRTGIDLVTSLSGPTDPKLESALSNPRLAVLGIVWNKVDDIMHGMEMQTAGMHSQVRLWGSQGHLQELLLRLHNDGFAVYLTADHGNVTAHGVGKPGEGVLVETKGSRARLYDHPDFRDEVAEKFPDSIRWPNHGLPQGRHVLLAGQLTAFVGEGGAIVSHGGIALEEVMVPFVAISREDA